MPGEPLDLASSWLLTFAIHGTAILASVALLARTRRLPESFEEVLWRFALVGALGTASLQIAFGGARIGAVALPTNATSRAAAPLDPWLASPTAVDVAPAPREQGRLAGAASESDDRLAIPLATWLLGIAGGLAALGLAQLGLRRLALRRLLVDRRPLLVDSPCRVALDVLRERLGMRRTVQLSVSAAIASPVAFGVLRPEICVPRQALRALCPAARDAMLAHELAHLVRRDPLWLEVAHTLVALFPWQPLLRIARRRMRTLAEFRCDELGAQWTGAVDVADCLVEVAGWLREGRGAAVVEGLVGMTVQRDGLEARVDRLLEGVPGPASRIGSVPLAAGLGLATVLLAAGLPGARADATDPEAVVGIAFDARSRSAVAEVAVDGLAATGPVAIDERFDPDTAALFEPLDTERAALAAELAALRVDVAQYLPDAELDSLLAELELRVASIDRRRAALAALFTYPEVSPTGAAQPFPSSRR